MKTFDSEDMRLMQQFADAKSRGFYVDGAQLTNLYNKIFGTQLRPTNCSSCINSRYSTLERELKIFKNYLKEQEEKLKALEVIDDFLTEPDETENKPKKRGRPKKKEE